MIINCLIVILLLIFSILAYFRIAGHYNIIDKPNHRSSHTELTIRGAGVIFPVSVLLCAVFFGDVPVVLLTGLLLASVISFVDDVKPLSAKIRLVTHFLSVTLVFYGAAVFIAWPWPYIAIAYVMAIGAINAFNFMDGINGITGIYAMVSFLSLWFINMQTNFAPADWMICPLIACVVFLYYNFRKKARCFAGDVGSISLAIWLVVLSIILIIETGSPKYLLFYIVYGTDVAFTIIKRLRLRQNIFEPHRLHVYQLLVHNGKYSHRQISLAYGLGQLSINLLIIFAPVDNAAYLLVLLPVAAYYFLNQRYTSHIL